MEKQIEYGSVSRTLKLDESGSTLKTTVNARGAKPYEIVRLDYTIRHRIPRDQPEQEDKVYDLFRHRQRVISVFNPAIEFEGKHKIKADDAPYFMIEKFTMYKNVNDVPYVKAFVEEEKKELGL